MNRNAFTIIEILITMIIMGTLSATLVPRIGDAREEAKNTMSKVDKSRELASEVDFDGYTFSSNSAGGGTNYSDLLPNDWEDITICDPNNSAQCITMMDRNLGATSNDINSTDSYGYHYQWGNNHGFASCLSNGCTSFPGGENTGTITINCENYGPTLGRYDSEIYRVSYMCNSNYENLRGGANDSQANNWGYPVTNPTERQGPCPVGYHVPSVGEWNKLVEYRRKHNGIKIIYYSDGTPHDGSSDSEIDSNLLLFQKYFMIPFAGRRSSRGNLQLSDIAYFNVSTPGGSEIHVFQIVKSYGIYNSNGGFNGAFANSIRCFKN